MELDTRHWDLLRAVMDRIVPADDFPSASQAGVEAYFKRQFNGDLAPQLKAYGDGLDALDAEAFKLFGHGFVELSANDQDTFLRKIESGETESEWPTESSLVFFHRLVEHVMEGYYGDPGNGGNNGAVSWGMIGFGGRKT